MQATWNSLYSNSCNGVANIWFPEQGVINIVDGNFED